MDFADFEPPFQNKISGEAGTSVGGEVGRSSVPRPARLSPHLIDHTCSDFEKTYHYIKTSLSEAAPPLKKKCVKILQVTGDYLLRGGKEGGRHGDSFLLPEVRTSRHRYFVNDRRQAVKAHAEEGVLGWQGPLRKVEV